MWLFEPRSPSPFPAIPPGFMEKPSRPANKSGRIAGHPMKRIVFLLKRLYHKLQAVKCEICKQRESVIHIQQVIGDERVDMYLCEVCAHEKGVSRSDEKIELTVSQLLAGLLEETRSSDTGRTVEECPTCGRKLLELRSDGRLGCPDCYNSFAAEIRAMQRNLSGSVRHKGKLPKKIREYKELLIDRENLRSELDEAVKNEDYEIAAALRDRIREIERRDNVDP